MRLPPLIIAILLLSALNGQKLTHQPKRKSYMNHSILTMKSVIESTTKIRIKNMIKYSMVISLLGILGALASPVLAADSANTATSAAKGKKLHEAKCFGCHDTRQYTRKNRIVHTYEDLHARVEFCDSASNAGFSFDDLDNVVTYLNTEFYKFKK